MAECDPHNMYPNLCITPSNDEQFKLNKINEIKDYFIEEIKERELMSKNLSKYIASFGYFDKSLIVLAVTTGSISIASFATVIGVPVGMMSAICNLEPHIPFWRVLNITTVKMTVTLKILGDESYWSKNKNPIKKRNFWKSLIIVVLFSEFANY